MIVPLRMEEGHPRLVLLEFQGDFQGERPTDAVAGHIRPMDSDPNSFVLDTVNRQRLVGKLQKLAKPLAVLRTPRRRIPTDGLDNDDKAINGREVKVVTLLTDKIIFSTRPTTILP